MFAPPTTDIVLPVGLLSRVNQIAKMTRHLEAEILIAATCWADLNRSVDDARALPGAERLVQLGGEGTPLVAEFCTAEFGAELGLSIAAADRLIGDALDLRHRLPVLWARVRAGEVKGWVARKLAQETRWLSAEHAGHVDKVISPYADRKPLGALLDAVQAEAIRLDPEGAKQRVEQAAESQGVWAGQSSDSGNKDIFIRTDAASAVLFDAQIGRIADDLQLLGDESSKDMRRGRAVGVIANPQAALDLRFDAMRAAGYEGPAAAKSQVDARPPATLYVHLTDQTLTTGTGVARVEGIGPVTADQAKRWLGRCDVTVKPVIDLNGQAPSDAYEVPDRLREAVHLAMPRDVFPYATNTSRKMDIDHTDPYRDDGPPGQTRIGKLGPLSRKPHRIKTHGDWQVQQPYPGIFIWRSPHGSYYLVDPTGTRRIDQAA